MLFSFLCQKNGFLGKLDIKFSDLDSMHVFSKTLVNDVSASEDNDDDKYMDESEDEDEDESAEVQIEELGEGEELKTSEDDASKPLQPDEHSSYEDRDKDADAAVDEEAALQLKDIHKDDEKVLPPRRAAFVSPATLASSSNNQPPENSSSSTLCSSSSEERETEVVGRQREVYRYHLRQDVRDAEGKLQGVAGVQVTIRGAGVTEYPERKRAMVRSATVLCLLFSLCCLPFFT